MNGIALAVPLFFLDCLPLCLCTVIIDILGGGFDPEVSLHFFQCRGEIQRFQAGTARERQGFDDRDGFGNAKLGQIDAIGERRTLDLRNARGDRELGELRTIGKRACAELGDGIGHGYADKALVIGKGVVTDGLYGFGKNDLREGTAVERIFADGFQTARTSKILDCRTAVERISLNFGNAVVKHDVFEGTALVEQTVRNGFDGFGQADFPQCITALEGVASDFRDGIGYYCCCKVCTLIERSRTDAFDAIRYHNARDIFVTP